MSEEKFCLVQGIKGVVRDPAHWSEQLGKFEFQRNVDSEYKLNAGFNALGEI